MRAGPGPPRFEVVKAKFSWGAYRREPLKPNFGGGFEDYSGGGPKAALMESDGVPASFVSG